MTLREEQMGRWDTRIQAAGNRLLNLSCTDRLLDFSDQPGDNAMLRNMYANLMPHV